MGFNRNKFKATTTSTLKSQEKKIGGMIKTGKKDRPDYLSIENGPNKFRIFPGHPETESFIYPRTVHWLPRKFKDRDTNETTIKNAPVFNSRVHGNTEKDIVEEYYRFAIESLTEQIQDEEELKAKVDGILSHWKQGILPKTNWVCYAKKMEKGSSKFGLLEITQGTKEKLNEIAIVEDTDEVIETDPFSDPDSGKAIIITKDDTAKDAKDYYKVTLEFRGDYSLNDDELEHLLEQKSLQEMYINSYSRKDFEIALEGLQIYDNKHKLKIFDDPQWLDIVEEIDSYYPESDEEADEESGENGSSEPLDAEDEKPEELNIEDMSRTDLKKYIKKEGLPIIVRKNMSDDDVRQAIYDALDDEDVELDEEEEEIEEQAPEENNSEEDDEADGDAKSKIAAMRNKLKNK